MKKNDSDCVVSEEKISLRQFIRENTHELGFVFGSLTAFFATSAIPVPFLRIGLSGVISFIGYQVVREVWDQFPPKSKSERRLLRFKYGLASIIVVVVYFTFLLQWDMMGGKEPQRLILSLILTFPIWLLSYEVIGERRKERLQVWLRREDKKPLRVGSVVMFELVSAAVVYSIVCWATPVISIVASWTRVR